MNSTELKAKAYDLLAQLEYLQKQLQEVNQHIAEAMQKEKAEEDGSLG